MITPSRQQDLIEAANILLDARRTTTPIPELPAALIPQSQEEAYFVQDTMATAYGPIGGWKVGAPSPEATPAFAPMPTAWIAANHATLHGNRWRAVEAEFAFHMATDLPPRPTPYTRAEVTAAIASCHPAIEVLELGLIDYTAVNKFSAMADMQMHGGFVYGTAIPNWQSINFANESVTVVIDGVVRVERTASNPGGTDLLRLMLYLANEGASRTGGLKKGDWITTGSWTGNSVAPANAPVTAKFTSAEPVTLTFA